MFLLRIRIVFTLSVRERVNGAMTIRLPRLLVSEIAKAFSNVSVQDRFGIYVWTYLEIQYIYTTLLCSGESKGVKTFYRSISTEAFETTQPHRLWKSEYIKPCVPIWIVLALYIDTGQVDSHVWNGFLNWLFWMLGVNMIPDERVFSGPQTRKNRLNYIFLVGTSFQIGLHGFQLCFTPSSGWSSISTTRPWLLKTSFIMIDYTVIREVIDEEAGQILANLRASSDPAKEWRLKRSIWRV